MKRKSSRYLGMTGTQIGILAALSVVAMLSIGGVVWTLLSMSSATGESALQIPITTPFRATPSPTNRVRAELALTSTASLTVTPTAAGTVAPPDGWVKFQTQGAALWLPGSFVGGDILNHKDQVIGQIKSLGSFFKSEAEAMKKPPTGTVLWMVDKTKDTSAVITSVRVRYQTLSNDTTLEQYIKDYLAEKSNAPTINGTKKLVMLGREARRLTYQELAGTLEYTRIDYFIKDESDFWVVSYIMNPNIYFDMLPMVEQSMQTFNLSK